MIIQSFENDKVIERCHPGSNDKDDHFATFVKSHLVLASIGTAFVTLQCVGQTKDKQYPVVHLDERFVRIKI